MFNKIVMRDYRKPIWQRHYEHAGPYYWCPPEAGQSRGRGFYQSSDAMAVDPHGSTFDLRIYLANDMAVPGTRRTNINGYFIDEFQNETLIPIVARLPSGRGYLPGWTMGAGMCAMLEYDIVEDPQTAVIRAHDLAERHAMEERLYNEDQDGEEVS